MKDQFINILTEILKISADALLMQFADAAVWDSVQKVEAIFALEDEFGIQFSEDELAESTTPEKLYESLIKKVG